MRWLRILGPVAIAAYLQAADRLAVSPHLLANGMKILVHEDHDIPNVAIYLFFKVGSRNERTGATGMSHFFEHMMFNGAKKYGPKQFDIEMEKNGGRNNAYTSQNVTVYQDWVPAAVLERIFDMEADRIQNLAFDPKIIESERGVVYSERRLSVDNNNEGLLNEQLWASAFTAHPYQWPVVGWASDIESWTIHDLKDHFRMGYAPNNCVAVIAGAVKDSEVMALAKRYWEPIPKHDAPPAVRTKEPEQLGERRLVVRKPAQAPLLMAAWHVPETKHADSYALDVLSRLLSRGRSSRLYRRLVDKDQTAIAVDASTDSSLDPTLLTVSVNLRPGGASASVEKALYEEIAKLEHEPVAQAEMQKVRNGVLAEFYRQAKTISGKANAIGQAEVFYGDWRKLLSYPDDIEKVSAADVQRVAKKYLTEKNRTVATLIPEEEAKP